MRVPLYGTGVLALFFFSLLVFLESGEAIGSLRLLAVGLVGAGIASHLVGSHLLIPRHGQVLSQLPVSDRAVWKYSFWKVPLFLVGFVLLAVLLFVSSPMSFGQAWLRGLGWLLWPLLGISWQFLRKGLSRIPWLRIGLLLGVLSFFLPILQLADPWRDWDESVWLSRLLAFAPSRWLEAGLLGPFLSLLVVVGTVLLWGRMKRNFRLLDTWTGLAAAGAREEAVGEKAATAVGLNRQGPKPSWGSRPLNLVLSKEERELGEVLWFRPLSGAFVCSLFFALVIGGLWLAAAVRGLSMTDFIGDYDYFSMRDFSFSSSWWITLCMMNGSSPSGVCQMAFRRLSAGGMREVTLLALFPISEKKIFRMFLKEYYFRFALFLVPQVLTLGFVSAFGIFRWGDGWLELFLVVLLSWALVRPQIIWTFNLWLNCETFPDSPRDRIKSHTAKWGYFLMTWALLLLFLLNATRWLQGRMDGSWCLLVASAIIAVVHGSCWWLRRRYRMGKGNLVLSSQPETKSFSFSKGK
ncbi:hypothetical protein [Roseibacillus ishigakijimensis]|uniref:Uncharacterized protein n=1 Tax=Roseibacillus ishigakijimensis TaxID=454146 RepID=A0A934RSZ2_9BACT|nr:hypothetical protein [Roseibacillus ishigakijimensis]